MADRKQEAQKAAEQSKSIIANTFSDKPSSKPVESNDSLKSKDDDMYSMSYEDAKKKYGKGVGNNIYFMPKTEFDKKAAEYNVSKQKTAETAPAIEKAPEPKQSKNKTWADVKSENGNDPKKIAEWLNNNPDYKPGEKTTSGMVELGYVLGDDGKWVSMDSVSDDTEKDYTNATTDDVLDGIDEISNSDPIVAEAVNSFTNPETGDVDETKTNKALSEYEQKLIELGAATLDENGNFVLKPTSKSKGWETWATLLSVGLSVIGIAAGIPILPINFKAVTGKDTRDAQIQALQQQYMNIKAGGAEKVEQMDADVKAGNIALKNQDALAAQEKHAQATAATKDVIGAQTGAEKELIETRTAAEIKRDEKQFERDMKRARSDKDFQLKLAGLNQQYAKEMTQLQSDLSTSGAIDIMKYQNSGFLKELQDLGITASELATFIAAKNGMSPADKNWNRVNMVSDMLNNTIGTAADALNPF
jgi:hypothetical protein